MGSDVRERLVVRNGGFVVRLASSVRLVETATASPRGGRMAKIAVAVDEHPRCVMGARNQALFT
jgi:hypothetical protein